MKHLIIITLTFFTLCSPAQFTITLMYKSPNCGGKKNPDTTSYFLLANRKLIIQYFQHKTKTVKQTDSLYTDINGKIKIPNKKGTYYAYEPWKYYHLFPADYPQNLYKPQCIEQLWQTPDFIIKVYSNKKYTLTPQYLVTYCPDKHPCLRTDTTIPKIPKRLNQR